jgi:hypothetical protein
MTEAINTTMPPSMPQTERDVMRTEYSAEERERMLARMAEIAESFYRAACRVGFHQFIEFAGLLNEHIKICKRMHTEGVDFGTTELDPKVHEMAYIAEKIDCIFGEALCKSETREAFLGALAAKGGWGSAKEIW